MSTLKFLISKDTKFAWNKDGKFHKYTSSFALVLTAILVTNLFWYAPIPHVDFYDELWGPAHLLLQGRSPYDTSSLSPMQSAGWFPMAIGLFFPLGWMSENIASKVWLIINIVGVCAMIYISQEKERILYATVILAVLCFFFPPMLHHFALGQISVTVTLSLVLSVYFLSKGQQWIAAFFIALAFSKPHLAVLPTLGLCYYCFRKQTCTVILFSMKILFMVFVLCLPLFFAFPNWIPDAIESISYIPFWQHPSLFIFFSNHLGVWGYISWGVMVISALIFSYQQWKYFFPAHAMYWSLALSSLLSPYVGSWDFVTLFPLLILTFSQVDWKRKMLIIASYGVAWRLMVLVQMQHNGLNYYFWWVPLWFIATLALVTNWKVVNNQPHSSRA